MSSPRENKQTLLEFYRLFYNEKQFDQGALLLADAFVNHHGGAREIGRQAFIESFGRHTLTSIPNFRIEAKRVVAEGDQVWTHNLLTGLPQDGRAVSVEIWRFENGAISEHWDVVQGVKRGLESGSML